MKIYCAPNLKFQALWACMNLTKNCLRGTNEITTQHSNHKPKHYTTIINIYSGPLISELDQSSARQETLKFATNGGHFSVKILALMFSVHHFSVLQAGRFVVSMSILWGVSTFLLFLLPLHCCDWQHQALCVALNSFSLHTFGTLHSWCTPYLMHVACSLPEWGFLPRRCTHHCFCIHGNTQSLGSYFPSLSLL